MNLRDPDDLYDEAVEPTRFEARAVECNRELAKALRDIEMGARLIASLTTCGERKTLTDIARLANAALCKWELSL